MIGPYNRQSYRTTGDMSKDEIENDVLKYLEKVNRPYSVNDVVQNLHNEITKSTVQKTLDLLVSHGRVREKIYNKQKIYTIVQNAAPSANVHQEVQGLEAQILEKTNSLRKVEQEFQRVETELSVFESTLTTSEAKKKRDELLETGNKLEIKLSSLSENRVSITKADRDKIEKQYDTISRAYRKRKRICLDILNSILEYYPKTKAALIEEVGMEMEENNGIVTILKS